MKKLMFLVLDVYFLNCKIIIYIFRVTSRDLFPGKTSSEILRMNKMCNIDFKIL